MAAKHWLVGCGIGCGVILMIVIGLGVAGSLFVKDTIQGFDAAVETRQTLDERFGDVRDFTPWPDGAIPAVRMEAFLAVREATADAREELVEAFASLPMTETEARELDSKPALEQLRSVFGIMGSAVGIGKQIGSLFDVRNRTLLDQEMGMGEYTYIYVVAYRSWLGHPSGDGPEDSAIDTHAGDVRIQRGRGGIGNVPSFRIHDDLSRQLRNQLEALPADAEPAWAERLREESELMEENEDRVPWEDGVPAPIAASLETFRDRLETHYQPVTNPFELIRNKRKGGFSIQAE